MAILTGTKHGDAANTLFGFYQDQAQELEESGHYFMAAIALAFATESAILAYLLVEFGDENGGELKIPASINFAELIEAANELDVLSAPVNVASQIRDDAVPPMHIAQTVIDQVRKLRNLIHPGRALRQSYDPRTFTAAQLGEIKEIYESVLHSLMYNL